MAKPLTTQYRKIKELQCESESGNLRFIHGDGESSFIPMGYLELNTDNVNIDVLHIGKKLVSIVFEKTIVCNVDERPFLTTKIDCGVEAVGERLHESVERIGGEKTSPLWRALHD